MNALGLACSVSTPPTRRQADQWLAADGHIELGPADGAPGVRSRRGWDEPLRRPCGGGVERPLFVAPRPVCVTASHRDHDVGWADNFVRPGLWVYVRNVDISFQHRLHH